MSRQRTNIVVVGVDGSPASLAAALWAAEEAKLRGAALQLAQAYDVTVGFAGPGMMITPDIDTEVRRGARSVLAAARLTVSAAHPDVEITTQLFHGRPDLMLRNASEQALLTVLGSHGQNPLIDSLLGSVAVSVASSAHGPVVIIRTDPVAGIAHGAGPVWVGVDGSGGSETALGFGFEEASLRGEALLAIHTWDNEPRDGFLSGYPVEVDRSRFHDQQRLLSEQLAGWSEKYPDVAVRPVLVRGRPAGTLLQLERQISVADKPSMIVVGSRGHGGFVGMLLGSTSQALIAHAHCPVVVAREPRGG